MSAVYVYMYLTLRLPVVMLTPRVMCMHVFDSLSRLILSKPRQKLSNDFNPLPTNDAPMRHGLSIRQ